MPPVKLPCISARISPKHELVAESKAKAKAEAKINLIALASALRGE